MECSVMESYGIKWNVMERNVSCRMRLSKLRVILIVQRAFCSSDTESVQNSQTLKKMKKTPLTKIQKFHLKRPIMYACP